LSSQLLNDVHDLSIGIVNYRILYLNEDLQSLLHVQHYDGKARQLLEIPEP
jgi:hypothetical protein